MSETPDRARFKARLEARFRADYPALVRRWRHRAGSVEDAEELIQDGFAALYRAYADTGMAAEDDAALGAALHATILNAWRDRLRRLARREGVIQRVTARVGDDGEEEDPLDKIVDLEVRTEDEAAVTQLLGRVMALLSPHWRNVLRLLLADHTPEDITTELGRDGYTLRREARRQFCRALAGFVTADPLAHWISGRVCTRIPGI